MSKISLLRKQILQHRIDAILITDLTNVKYLTGFTGSSGFALVSARNAIFVTDFRYQEQAKHEINKGFRIKIEHTERSREIKNICDVYGIRKLGFEDHDITYGFYRKLGRIKIGLRPVTNCIASLRIIKSPEEMSFIKASIQRAERAFKKFLPYVKSGSVERKLALKFEELLKEHGCKKLPFDVIVASGPMSALPHAKPTNRKIKKGDLVVIDWGGEYEGYYSDMTRTLLVKGENMSRQKQLYNTVLEAQRRAIEKTGTGVKTADIDAAARDYIRSQGYDEYFGHGTGHGVGLEVHEKPVLSWRSKEIVKEHMVFTIEPGIYIPGFGGVRIEDMAVVNKGGAEVITSLPHKLKIIEV